MHIKNAGGSGSRTTDVQPVQTFRDTTARSGERYGYAVETSENLLVIGPVDLGSVVLPGARITDVSLDFATASATILWEDTGSLSTSGVDVYRRVGDGPAELRFQMTGSAPQPLEDVDLRAGVRYTYSLRTHFSGGLDLTSTSVDRGFFLPRGQARFVTGTPEHIRLEGHPGLVNPSFPNLGSILRVQALPNGSVVAARLSDAGTIYGFQGILRPTGATDPESVSAAFQPVGPAHLMLLSIAGGTAQLEAFAIPNAPRLDPFGMPAIEPLTVQSSSWTAPPGVTRTALTVSDTGVVYAAVGSALRIYTSELQLLGEVDLNTPSPVTDIALTNTGDLWAALPETGEILRSPPVLSGGSLLSPSWTSVDVPGGAVPTSLRWSAQGGMLALDEGNGRVLAYNPNGTPAMDWGGLEGLALESGPNGILESRDAVYVWDSEGTAVVFRNE